MRPNHLSVVVLATSVASQSLLQAISGYAELSNFTALLTDNPNLADALLTTNTSSLIEPATVLIPSNEAFSKVSSLYNVSMSSLSIEQLEPYLLYHILVGQVTTTNLTSDSGLTVPSFLTGPEYNNRTGGVGLGSDGSDSDPANGQVVFLQPQSTGGQSQRRFAIRQLQNPAYNATGGLGETINLTAVDGTWSGGYFQIVDSFLGLPLNCTTTFARYSLTSFLTALRRSSLGDQVDITQNLTCIAPTDDAFLSAGSPQDNTDLDVVGQTILFHTLTMPAYSSFLVDGQEFLTFSNETVRVSVSNDGTIMLNDAIVISTDVITNNGLMYVVDRVMSPLSEETNGNNATATTFNPTATGSGATATVSVSVTATVTAGASMSAPIPVFDSRIGYVLIMSTLLAALGVFLI